MTVITPHKSLSLCKYKAPSHHLSHLSFYKYMETTPSNPTTKQNAASLPPGRGLIKSQIFNSIVGKLSSAVMKDCQALAKNKRASAAAATATSLPQRRGRVKAEIFKSISGKLHSVVTKDCQALAKAKWGPSATAAGKISTSATAATGFPSRRGRVKAEIFKSIAAKLSSIVTKDCQALAKTKWGSSATAASKISTSPATATSLPPRWGRVKAQFFESIPGKLSAAVTKACQAKRCSSAAVDNMSTSTSAATSPPPSAYASVGYPDQLWNMGDLE